MAENQHILEKAKALIGMIRKRIIIYTIGLMSYPLVIITEEVESYYENMFYGIVEFWTFCFCVLFLFFIFKNLSKITKIEQKLKLDTPHLIQTQDFSDIATFESKKILTGIIASRMIAHIAILVGIFGLLSFFWFLVTLDMSNSAVLIFFRGVFVCFFVWMVVSLIFHFKNFFKFLKIEKNIKAAIQYCYKTQDRTDNQQTSGYTKTLTEILVSKMIICLVIVFFSLSVLGISLGLAKMGYDIFFETREVLFFVQFGVFGLLSLLVIFALVAYSILFFKNLFRIYQIQKRLESDFGI